MSALKNGDVIALYLDDDDDKLGAKLGYLGSDPTALSSVTATIEEELLVVPMVHTPMVHILMAMETTSPLTT